MVSERSVSVWRLQAISTETGVTRAQIATVIGSLLAPVTGVDAEKKKGLAVLRVKVRLSPHLPQVIVAKQRNDTKRPITSEQILPRQTESMIFRL